MAKFVLSIYIHIKSEILFSKKQIHVQTLEYNLVHLLPLHQPFPLGIMRHFAQIKAGQRKMWTKQKKKPHQIC